MGPLNGARDRYILKTEPSQSCTSYLALLIQEDIFNLFINESCIYVGAWVKFKVIFLCVMTSLTSQQSLYFPELKVSEETNERQRLGSVIYWLFYFERVSPFTSSVSDSINQQRGAGPS